VAATTVASTTGGNLVLEPRRPALETRHNMFGGGPDQCRVDSAPAPDTGGTITGQDDLEPLDAVGACHSGNDGRMAAGTERHWFEELADHMGPAYLRYAFTKGTRAEIDELLRRVPLRDGARVLDVGCGPGRHAHELGRRGFVVHGVDISEAFVDLAGVDAPGGVTFAAMDARTMKFDGEFDLVLSVCQGAFGLSGGPAAGRSLDPDRQILERMGRAVRPGGHVVFTAFNAYLQVANLLDGNEFDAERGVHCEVTEVRDPAGVAKEVELWTTCFTPRELRLLCELAGLSIESMTAAEPGNWTDFPPDGNFPELLVIARREG